MMAARTPFFLRTLIFLAAVGLFLFAPLGAQAQTVPVNLSWANPTALTDGTPATGSNAQTGVEVHWATSAIADAAACLNPCTGARTAQATLGVVQTIAQQVPATNGATFYFRVKALNAAGKSAFSNQATHVVSVPTPTGPPTNFRVDLVVSRLEDGSVSLAMLVREAWEETIYNGG